MSISSKVAGAWQTMSTIYAKRSGVWETVKKVYSKQAGVWQQVYAFLGIAWTLKASFAGKRVGFVYYHEANATYYATVHEANGSASVSLYTSTDLINWTLYGTVNASLSPFGVNSKIVMTHAYSYLNPNNSKVVISFEGVWYNSNGGASFFGLIVDIVPTIPPPNALSGYSYTAYSGTGFNSTRQVATNGTDTMLVGFDSDSQLFPNTSTQTLVAVNSNGVSYNWNSSYWGDNRAAITFPLKRFTGTAFGAGKWVMVGAYQYLCVASNFTSAVTKYLTLLGSDSLHFGGVAFGNGTFVAVSEDGKIITSTNAITWTSPLQIATGYKFTGMFYYRSLFVTLSQGFGQLNAWSSADGISWIKNSINGVSGQVVLSSFSGPYPMVSGNATTLVASGDSTGVYAY